MFCGLASKYPYKYPKCWNFEKHRSEELNLSLKTPSRLVLFLVKLLTGLFPSCVWKSSGTRCFLLLYSHSCLFSFQTEPLLAEIKYLPLQSLKLNEELENSHLSYFSVTLTDICKIIAKYFRKVIFKYRQKSLFISLWEPTIMFIF